MITISYELVAGIAAFVISITLIVLEAYFAVRWPKERSSGQNIQTQNLVIFPVPSNSGSGGRKVTMPQTIHATDAEAFRRPQAAPSKVTPTVTGYDATPGEAARRLKVFAVQAEAGMYQSLSYSTSDDLVVIRLRMKT
jgi:hypothetical protein